MLPPTQRSATLRTRGALNAPSRSERHTTPEGHRLIVESRLEELLLLVGEDGAVRGRVRDARQAEAVAHLVVVEEGAVRLVDGARDDLARARRARARTARVRHVNAILLRLVDHVRVLSALDRLLAAVLLDEGDLE